MATQGDIGSRACTLIFSYFSSLACFAALRGNPGPRVQGSKGIPRKAAKTAKENQRMRKIS